MRILNFLSPDLEFNKSVSSRFKYVTIFDVDEVIVPTNPEDYTWRDLEKRFSISENYDAFSPLHSVMMNLDIPPNPEFPEYHYILQHTEVMEFFHKACIK